MPTPPQSVASRRPAAQRIAPQPLPPIAPKGEPFADNPFAEPVDHAPPAETNAVVPQVNVMDLLRSVATGAKRLASSSAGYTSLMQAIDSPNAPTFSWAARELGSDNSIEVLTDISRIKHADRAQVLIPLANLHAAQMRRACRVVFDAAADLLAFLDAQQGITAADSDDPVEEKHVSPESANE